MHAARDLFFVIMIGSIYNCLKNDNNNNYAFSIYQR